MEEKATSAGFLGRGWAWPPVFDHATGEVEMLAGEADIRNSLELMLATRAGERELAPLYGANMQDLVFEPMDVGTKTIMRNRLIDRIRINEPRVVAEDVRFEEDRLEGVLKVSVTYRVIATNNRYNLVYPYYLDGGKEAGA
jgi:phage baseplate assembly protein W